MDFAFSREEEAFREEVRSFLKEVSPRNFPPIFKDLGYGFGGWSFEYHRVLAKKGYIGLTWPKEYGGKGLPPTYLYILMQEGAFAHANMEALFYTEAVGFSIVTYGSDTLKNKFLPGAVASDITFCEGLSEPGAGTDLLNMKTRAREGKKSYIIDGQKVWQSNGALASHGIVACITDPEGKRGRNISCFIVDSKTPGITIRPIKEITGEETYAEMFFDGVHVPKENMIGQKNGGFAQVMDCLIWDRFWARAVKAPYCQRILQELVQYCNGAHVGGKLLADDPVVRNKLANMAIEIEVSSALDDHVIAAISQGRDVTISACMVKVFADEMGQRFFQSAIDILGLYGQLTTNEKWAPLQGRIEHKYLGSFGLTLAGGSSEIQRTTIATRGFGLVG